MNVVLWNVEDSFFSPNNLLTKQSSKSLTGHYTLTVEKYSGGYTKSLIGSMEIKQPYLAHGWAKQNDREYLIISEQPQRYSVIDLLNSKIYTYVDKKDPWGFGFGWKNIKVSPDGKLLAVTGSYFPDIEANYIYDFSNPTNLPLPKLKVIDEQVARWIDNSSVELISGKIYHITKGIINERTS
jgi:hypothetical protein